MDRFRCPAQESDHNAESVMFHYLMLEQHSVWPAPGGTLDQSAQFIEAVRLIGNEKSLIQEEIDRLES